jgi:uncharacterized protein (DUF433 family)
VVRELGRFVVCDPLVCHGAPTIRGTRLLVRGVLGALEAGMTWDEVVRDCDGKVTHETIAEVIRLASEAFLEKYEPVPQPV